MKRISVICLLLMFSTVSIFAQINTPNPMRPARLVNDFAGLFTEAVLTDGVVGRIIDKVIIEPLKSEDYYSAVSVDTSEVADISKGEQVADVSKGGLNPIVLFFSVVVISFLVLWLIIVVASKWTGRGGRSGLDSVKNRGGGFSGMGGGKF